MKTKCYFEEEKINKFIYRGVFGTQKNGGILNNVLDLKFKNIANTHVVKLGDEILALWEAAGPHAPRWVGGSVVHHRQGGRRVWCADSTLQRIQRPRPMPVRGARW